MPRGEKLPSNGWIWHCSGNPDPPQVRGRAGARETPSPNARTALAKPSLHEARGQRGQAGRGRPTAGSMAGPCGPPLRRGKRKALGLPFSRHPNLGGRRERGRRGKPPCGNLAEGILRAVPTTAFTGKHTVCTPWRAGGYPAFSPGAWGTQRPAQVRHHVLPQLHAPHGRLPLRHRLRVRPRQAAFAGDPRAGGGAVGPGARGGSRKAGEMCHPRQTPKAVGFD